MKYKFFAWTLIEALFLMSVQNYVVAATSVAKPESKSETQLRLNPNNIQLRQSMAHSLVIKKKYQEALTLLSPYSNEISDESLADLASAYAGLNDPLNEIRALQILIEKDSTHFRPRFLLGMAYKNNKKYNEAAQNFRKSIEFAPQHRPSYDALLDIFMETKQNYEVRTLVADMVQKFGQKSEFRNLQCKYFAIDGFLAEALTHCQNAVRQDPKFPDNHIYLAQTYFNQNNKIAAERIFKTAGRQFSQSEFVQYATGEFYLSDKNYTAAVRYLKLAVRLNAKSLRSQLTLALALFETREYAEALTHLEKSCDIDKSKETLTTIKTSAAKLRQKNEIPMAEQYDRKAALCQH